MPPFVGIGVTDKDTDGVVVLNGFEALPRSAFTEYVFPFDIIVTSPFRSVR